MREYAKAEPKMWHGETMKALRKTREGLIVGLYLMTSPSSNMLGLFAQPVLYMAYETGLGEEGARKGLRSCIEAGFCSYDEPSEMVWVHEMARYQIASELKATDKQCVGIQKAYDALPKNPYLGAFFDRYVGAFHLTKRRGNEGASYAPSKPLRSQEQEQEQEQEQAQEQEVKGADAPLPPAPPAPPAAPPAGLFGDSSSEEPDPSVVPPCPHAKLLALFAKAVPELPQPRRELWEDSAGAEAMRQRWKWLLTATRSTDDDRHGQRYATNAAEGIEWFRLFFDQVAASDFLTGRNGKWKNCDLSWLMKRENFSKVIQKNYVNKEPA